MPEVKDVSKAMALMRLGLGWFGRLLKKRVFASYNALSEKVEVFIHPFILCSGRLSPQPFSFSGREEDTERIVLCSERPCRGPAFLFSAYLPVSDPSEPCGVFRSLPPA